ncbi:MAG: polyisoprenoid-binding protein [Rhodospirillales bacterium]|nr:polyisoprenoid-binding protein [Rhodospirillales bacterium]
MSRKVLVAALALAALSAPALAGEKFPLDPSHTSIYFIHSHFGFSKMIGRFNESSGEIDFEKDNIPASKVKVVIKASSIDTNHAKRDDHLRSPDFFNVKEFPEITFVSTGIEKTGERSGKLMGNLTMVGVTKPVVLDATFNKDDISPPSKKFTIGFSARGKIKRSDFGMKYGVPNLGDELEMLIETEAVRQ